jgi:hypothetical protein
VIPYRRADHGATLWLRDYMDHCRHPRSLTICRKVNKHCGPGKEELFLGKSQYSPSALLSGRVLCE